jgi:hypothetical protein
MAESLVSVFLPAIVLLVVAVTGVWFVGYRCRAPQQLAPAATVQEQRSKKHDDVSRMHALPSESVCLLVGAADRETSLRSSRSVALASSEAVPVEPPSQSTSAQPLEHATEHPREYFDPDGSCLIPKMLPSISAQNAHTAVPMATSACASPPLPRRTSRWL